MIVQLGAKIGGDGLCDFNRRELNAALADAMMGERRGDEAAGLASIEQRLDLAVPFHPLGKTGPAGALARAEHWADQRKETRGLNEQPGRSIGKMLRVQIGQAFFEIVVHQGDGEIAAAFDKANAEFSQRVCQFSGAFNVDRLNPHAAFLQVLLGEFRRDAEARPIASDGIIGEMGGGENVTAVDQPFDRVLDCLCRVGALQAADEIAKALFSLSDRGGECTIKLAMKQEFPVLGVEADDIGRDEIDGKIRREARNLFAVEHANAFPVIACHEFSIRILMP